MSRYTRAQYDELPEILVGEEVARILGTSPAQVNRLAAAGRIPAHRLGRVWRFSKTRLEQFVAEGGGHDESPGDG